MILYHASPKKFRILKPAKPASFSKRELVHDSVVWFAKRLDYTIFMVLFRCVEEEYSGKYRFFDRRKKALFYPDQHGPLLKNTTLFKELFQKARELELTKPCGVYVHKVTKSSQNFKKSKWGDYYTGEDVVVDRVIQIVDALKYLKKQGWDIRILTH